MGLKGNTLTLISLACSVVGLILIYIAALNIQPKEVEISDITPELTGRSVSTVGEIVHRRTHKDGHLFLTISDGKKDIEVPLFASYMNSLKEVNLTEDDFQEGTKISVSGLLDEYKGSLQIIPRKPDDIKILSD